MLDDIKKTLCATADKLRANMDATKQTDIGKRIDDALKKVGLDKRYARAQLPDGKLGGDDCTPRSVDWLLVSVLAPKRGIIYDHLLWCCEYACSGKCLFIIKGLL